jgi:hypothetical protein
MSDTQNTELERKLQGRTLRVYLYLQRKKVPSGIREVQRDLGLSSPSVADYQIEKLVEMGLASRDEYGRVYVTRHVRVKALQSYVSLGQFMVPRLAFYATIFTAITAFYLTVSAGSANIYGVAIPAAAAGLFWFEAIKMWHIQLGDKTPAAKVARDNRDFWVSLVPGMVALAVFIAAAIFLFYYVEPNGIEPEAFPVNPDGVPMQGSAPPITMNDLRDLERESDPSSHANIVANFPVSIITGFLFAGAVVAGFLVYLLVKYRCREGVLTVEQE